MANRGLLQNREIPVWLGSVRAAHGSGSLEVHHVEFVGIDALVLGGVIDRAGLGFAGLGRCCAGCGG